MFWLAAMPAALGEADRLENWIRQVAQGDKEALGLLYQQTGAGVYGYALSILKSRQDAEDVQQEVYLQVWRSAASYSPKGKPMAWIFTITKNLALMRLREQKRTVAVSPQDWEAAFADLESVDREDGIVLKELLETLSDEERQIVVLHAVAGFKHREIASLMKLGLGTVLSKYNRALKKLKNLEKGEAT